MTRKTAAAVLLLMSLAGPALAESCEQVKADIAKKIDAHGVKGYTLTIIGKDETADGKVVGSCEHGAKAIVYKKG